jgi:hypothetical protein
MVRARKVTHEYHQQLQSRQQQDGDIAVDSGPPGSLSLLTDSSLREQRTDGDAYVIQVRERAAGQAAEGGTMRARLSMGALRHLSAELRARFPYLRQLDLPLAVTAAVDAVGKKDALVRRWLLAAGNTRAFWESDEVRRATHRSMAVRTIDGEDMADDSQVHRVSFHATDRRRHVRGDYMLYILHVQFRGRAWQIGHRYGAFVALSARLLAAHKDQGLSLMRLPPKVGRREAGAGPCAAHPRRLLTAALKAQGAGHAQRTLTACRLFFHAGAGLQGAGLGAEGGLRLRDHTHEQAAAVPERRGAAGQWGGQVSVDSGWALWGDAVCGGRRS